MGKLSEGPGNLVRQVEMLKELGAKTNKSLAPEIAGTRVGRTNGPPGMRTLFNFGIVVLGAWLLVGCASSMPVDKRDNFAYLYGKGSAQMPLQARVHHITPSNQSRCTTS